MNFFDSVVLGVVEGFTEFLPVSSTAHLLFAEKLLNIGSSEFAKTFAIAVQSGAILAVVFVYYKRFFKQKDLFLKLVVGFIPTMIGGLLLYKIIKNVFFESMLLILSALFVGGIVMILVEHFKKEKPDQELVSVENITYKNAILLGLYQVLAMIPGVSRSGATIIGGRLSGIPKKQIVEFSFLLAIPTILGATFVELLKDGVSISSQEIWLLIVGIVVSFVTAILGIRFFLNFIQKNSFKIFLKRYRY